MKQFFARFGKYLESRDVWYHVNLEDRKLKALLPLYTGGYLFKLWFTDNEEFEVLCQLPVHVPVTCRTKTWDLVERMNGEMPNGIYECNVGEGTIYTRLRFTMIEDDDFPEFVILYSAQLADRLFLPFMDEIFRKATIDSEVVKKQLRQIAGKTYEDPWDEPWFKGPKPEQDEERDKRFSMYMAKIGLPKLN
ncbi:hypothetical protein OAK45_08030 [Verrucomicrobia bacterium]|nr:hypothetical protein [Verrucomicrobiota bacterium]